jgi:hypothetical protein
LKKKQKTSDQDPKIVNNVNPIEDLSRVTPSQISFNENGQNQTWYYKDSHNSYSENYISFPDDDEEELLHQKPHQSPHYNQQQQQQQSENESSYLKHHAEKEFEFEQQQQHSETSEQIDSYGAPLDQPLGSSSSYESYKLVSTTTTTTSTTTTTPCPCRYVKKEDEESTEKYKTPIYSETIYYPIITTTTTTTTPTPPRYVSSNDHTGISLIFLFPFIYHYLLF